MIFKVNLFIVLAFTIAVNAFAQKQNVYYLKNSGKPVSTKDSADYIRVLSEPDSGTVLYNVQEFYPNGKLKLIAKSAQIQSNFFEGPVISYYNTWKRKQIANYKANKLVGAVYDYFPNGKLYTFTQYSAIPPGSTNQFNDNYTIQSCYDSIGKALVTDGNGYFVGYDDHFKTIYEEGNIKDGVRDGNWKGKDEIRKNDTVKFVEDYDKGKMITGRATDTAGKIITYTKRQIEPEFKGGEAAFGRFLQDNIRYPYSAKLHNTQGRVYVKFVVEKDGSLSDMDIFSSPDSELSAESIRVLKKSPKWTPGLRYGLPVRVQFTVPINYSLSQ